MTSTVLRTGPYRAYFYSHEPNEPPHVHVDRDEQSAKFWLEPVALARNLGFSARELRRIEQILVEHEKRLLEAWHGYYSVTPFEHESQLIPIAAISSGSLGDHLSCSDLAPHSEDGLVF
jgi:hypothetical protein